MSWGIKGLASLSTPGKSLDDVRAQTSLLAVDVGGVPGATLDARISELTGKRFRRMGRFIQLALSAAVEAVHRSGRKVPAKSTGVFLATGLGNLSDMVPFSHAIFGDPGFHVSAIQFANSVGNAGAFYIAQALDTSGPVLALSQDEVSFECALLQATELIDCGDLELALVGAVDVVMPPAKDHLARMGHPPDAPLKLAEGSAWWLLGRSEPGDFATLETVSMHTEASRDAGFFAERDFDIGTSYARGALVPTLFLENAKAGEQLECISRTREGLTGRVKVRRGAT